VGRANPAAGVTALQRVRDALDAANCRTRDNGRNWTCPSHEDANPSLSVTEGRDGRVLVRCHAGCEFDAIVAAIGLQPADLAPATRDVEWTPFGEPVATYRYVDQRGKLLYGVCRFEPKTFRQWRPDESKRGGRSWSVRGVTLVPYRLPELLAAVADGRPVHVVEGEKDVAAIVAAGGEATTFAMGAGKWRPGYAKWFEGADVVVVADDDEPGHRHAATVARALAGVAATVRIVKAAEGKDAADHLAAGHGLDQFAPLWVEGATTGTDIVEGSTTGTGIVEGAATIAVAMEAGADVLADTERFLRRYVVFASSAQAVTATLFAEHTHAFEAAEVTPYLHVTSAEKRSAKTLLLDLLQLLARKPLLSANSSVAALFRSIDDPAPTVLFDEVQELFGRKADEGQRELRAVLNAGYRVGGNVRRCVGEGAAMVAADFPVFCPKVLAGTGTLPDMLADRCIPIRLKRKARDAAVQRFRRRDAIADADRLRARLAGWAATAAKLLADARPELPEALNDRQQDIWEPLLAIADAAGGDWPQRARAAAIELHGGEVTDDSVGVLLLRHVRETFEQHGALDRITTAELLAALVDRDDGPWGDWWGDAVEADKLKGPAVRLAKLLKPYDIAPKVLRFGEGTERGYERAAFTEAWAIYCPEDVTDVTAQVRGPFQHETAPGPVTTPKPALTSSVTSVTSEGAEPGSGGLLDDPEWAAAAATLADGEPGELFDADDHRDPGRWAQ
jgi:antitoxin (DNA-binding transcriptional repressor) of toxin-antitoxin stability system